jgi:hypothetical protein
VREINCPNCNQHIKILGTDYDLYLENLKKEEQEIERLNNIIKEAINYIDDNTYYKDHKGHINIDDLYIILKGSDKE